MNGLPIQSINGVPHIKEETAFNLAYRRLFPIGITIDAAQYSAVAAEAGRLLNAAGLTEICELKPPTVPLGESGRYYTKPTARRPRDASILIPDHAALPPLYATDGTPAAEKTVSIRLFTPRSSWTWYLVEYNPEEALAFGYAYNAAHPTGAEWGYISLVEMQGLPPGTVERDLYFQPQSFAAVAARDGLDVYTD